VGAATLIGMRVVFGADHAGYLLKDSLLRAATAAGYAVADLGTDSSDPVDYPDFAAAVAREVAAERAERGVIVCGSGAGASIAANKVRGVRCAVAHDTYTAHQMVEHDDVNVLAVGSRVIGPALAEEILFAFLGAHFTEEERHRRRLSKIIALEEA
jgi:ribose 5-phosphate isomerase B